MNAITREIIRSAAMENPIEAADNGSEFKWIAEGKYWNWLIAKFVVDAGLQEFIFELIACTLPEAFERDEGTGLLYIRDCLGDIYDLEMIASDTVCTIVFELAKGYPEARLDDFGSFPRYLMVPPSDEFIDTWYGDVLNFALDHVANKKNANQETTERKIKGIHKNLPARQIAEYAIRKFKQDQTIGLPLFGGTQ